MPELNQCKPYQSKAGYTGAITLLLLAFSNYFFFSQSSFQLSTSFPLEQQLVIMVAFAILTMIGHEYLQRRKSKLFKSPHASYLRTPKLLIKSSLYRYLVFLGLILIPWFIVSNHYYFQDHSFNSTRLFYRYLVYIYIFLGLPYIYLTLKFKGQLSYDFNDYAILTMISLKVIIYSFWGLFSQQQNCLYRLANRRIKKVFLVFLINFFFLTLMSKFLMLEYNGFSRALDTIMAADFGSKIFFSQYHTVYLLLFHLIFVIDVGLAIIGYSIASRWLDNRTKSVDMSLYGWFVVLLCYPPMNSGFTDQFIGYGRVETEQLVTSEISLMIIMPFILACFFIYVWATAALGFKFSNLTNRGIISHGPYQFFRHPAYSSKNLAWWIDNTYVLSNIWAALALLTWNVIYIMRGLTEEKHLQKDKEYHQYQQQVSSRFIPWFKNNK